MTEDKSRVIMRLMPIWVLVLVFASAGIQAVYPSVDIISILDQEWIQMLLISMGLGGIPLSMFKRVVKDAKEVTLSDDVKKLIDEAVKPKKDT